jgi:cobalt/nickel transport system permease protein
MKHFFIDNYSSNDSVIHRVSSQKKLLFCFVMILSVLLLPPIFYFLPQLFIALFLLSLIYISKIPILSFAKKILCVLPFLFFIIILNYFFGNFSVYEASFLLIRASLSISFLFLCVSIIPFTKILSVFARWRFPKIILFMLSFMYRYIFILQDEIEILFRVIKLRSYKLSWFERLKVFGTIIGVMFIKSYERAERVYNSMILLGFEEEYR